MKTSDALNEHCRGRVVDGDKLAEKSRMPAARGIDLAVRLFANSNGPACDSMPLVSRKGQNRAVSAKAA